MTMVVDGRAFCAVTSRGEGSASEGRFGVGVGRAAELRLSRAFKASGEERATAEAARHNIAMPELKQQRRRRILIPWVFLAVDPTI
jgi:hypothetical protein